MDKNQYYRKIPKIDRLLEQKEIKDLIDHYGKKSVLAAIQDRVDSLRLFICDSKEESKIDERLKNLIFHIQEKVKDLNSYHVKHVINATGTILHTNLGRAPLSMKHAAYLSELVTGYSNLEYDLETGKRGERYSHFEPLIRELTGAEAAVAVNNNAAAVLLMLSALTSKKEVLVSRGELIEIGGKFRIPDVMEQSNSVLVEVGTTNKTHKEDYESAITAETAAILKVHTSNYKIIGFTESVERKVLSELCKQHGLLFLEDLGSGTIVDLAGFGLSHEATVLESVAQGADLVCFSGDKLLGGPQAGIIAGKEKYIGQLKKHPLMRALRIDKFTASALELVFHDYLFKDADDFDIPVLQMLKKPMKEIQRNAETLLELLKEASAFADIAMIEDVSAVGGGALPGEYLPTRCLAIVPFHVSVTSLLEALRKLPLPVIARISGQRLLIDLRTVFEREMKALASGILKVLLC